MPPGKADVPPVCVWRDEASGAEVVLLYETAYGTEKDVFVLPNGVALTAAWKGDNVGPPDLAVVAAWVAELRARFPGAAVTASTFETFFDVANSAAVKPLLPVVTAEIGDAWLYGVPSDPLKNALFREAARQRAACLAGGAECAAAAAGGGGAEHPAMVAFDRLLVKVPEHTWGVAQAWFLPDYENYTNAAFDAARAAGAAHGFVPNNTAHADYNSTANSWAEQRTYVTAAPALLQASHPGLAANLSAALAALAHVMDPSADAATMAGYERVDGWSSGAAGDAGDTLMMVHDCGGGVSVGFDGSGALSTLSTPTSSKAANSALAGVAATAANKTSKSNQWASVASPLGRFLYETYNNSDYDPFLADMAARLGDKGVWPHHSYPAGPSACAAPFSNRSSDASLDCDNFRKPGMTDAAAPRRRSLAPTVTQLWRRKAPTPLAQAQAQAQAQARGGSGAAAATAAKCDFLLEAAMPEEAAANAGAPRRVVTRVVVTVGAGGGGGGGSGGGGDGAVVASVEWDVVQVQKRPTRLPEAEFFSFVPAVAADAAGASGKGSAWRLTVLGQTMDPTDVLGAAGDSLETAVFGGSPHLRGVEAATWTGAAGTLTFTSLDVPIMCLGEASPFVSPRTAAPDMARGVHFNIVQNIWNTNYVLWYPFDEADENIRSRFRLDIGA